MKNPATTVLENQLINRRASRRWGLLFLALGAGALLSSGCAQYTAMKQPKPFRPAAAVVGANRGNVTAELGAPLDSEEQNGRLTETYKYVDGGAKNNGASKFARVILYTAGDVFTIFLDQVVTWPLEIYGFAGTPHVVTVDYVKGENGLWRANGIKDVEQASKEEVLTSEKSKPKSPR